jgi:hypothetical protein
MSIFVEPLIDQLHLIGEEDPEDMKQPLEASGKVDSPDEKGFFENLLEYMDAVFLKHPRPMEVDLSADLGGKRLTHLEDTLKTDFDMGSDEGQEEDKRGESKGHDLAQPSTPEMAKDVETVTGKTP